MVTRRTVLKLPGVALLGVAGCHSGRAPSGSGSGNGSGNNDTERLLRDRVRAAEAALVADYDVALRADPTLGAVLRPVRAHHAAHLAALGGAAAAPQPSRTGPAAGAPAPGAASRTVRQLAAAEGAAARRRAADAAAASGVFAGLLASIAASEAEHALALAGRSPAASGAPPGAAGSGSAPAVASGSPTASAPALPPAELAALQAALAGEHAAVYGYGVVGSRLSGVDRAAAERALVAHRAARDVLVAEIAAGGATPVPAEAAYLLPFPVAGAATAVRLAVVVEDRLATRYLALVGAAATAPGRTRAVTALQNTAVAATQWRQRGGLPLLTTAFPGR